MPFWIGIAGLAVASERDSKYTVGMFPVTFEITTDGPNVTQCGYLTVRRAAQKALPKERLINCPEEPWNLEPG